MTESKGYKFRIEVKDTLKADNKPEIIFTVFGDSAIEVVENYGQLFKQWYEKVRHAESDRK